MSSYNIPIGTLMKLQNGLEVSVCASIQMIGKIAEREREKERLTIKRRR